ncbi:MAG: hypothetical protein WCH57_08025 [Verrucomicrobiota bacterium]
MKHLLTALCLGATLAFASHAHAQSTPTPMPVRHTVIASVSSDSITIDTGKKTITYQIGKQTKCFFMGKLVTSSDLQTGMRVSVTPAFDEKTAEAINASTAPKAASPSPTPKK